MLRILFLITLYCTGAYASTKTDSLLYIEFKNLFSLQKEGLDVQSFCQSSTLNDSEPIGRYKSFVPSSSIDSEGVYWQPGTRVKVGDFDVLHYMLWHSYPKRLYGPMWVDQLVAVYTQAGKLVDSRIVLRLQDYYDGEIRGTSKPYNLSVKHVQVLGSDFDNQLTFHRSYSISPQGKIEMSHAIAPVDVRSKIGKARLWPKGRITNETLHEDNRSAAEKSMPTAFVEYYMPIPDDIYRWEWNWGIRHNEANYTVLLSNAFAMRLGRETSARDIYVITTIDKQGKVIDQRILGHNTPRERTQITSDKPNAITIDSYSLSFRDFYTLDDEAKHSRTLYRIDPQGRISTETLFSEQPISSSKVP